MPHTGAHFAPEVVLISPTFLPKPPPATLLSARGFRAIIFCRIATRSGRSVCTGQHCLALLLSRFWHVLAFARLSKFIFHPQFPRAKAWALLRSLPTILSSANRPLPPTLNDSLRSGVTRKGWPNLRR